MAGEKQSWLNRTVLGVGLTSLFSDWSHETATAVLPAFLAAIGAGPAWLGTIEGIADEYAGKVKVGKLDVDSNQQTAFRYGIRGIPTLLLFKGGQILEQRTGAIGKPEFQKMLDKHL